IIIKSYFIMAIYFSNSNLKKLSPEQFRTLGQLADAVNASTVDEPEAADNAAMQEYLKQYQAKAAAEAAAQQALISSLI
ncbi:MAG: hypothetical protein ACI4EX_04245, partial [Lachnospiraceae bacterium]